MILNNSHFFLEGCRVGSMTILSDSAMVVYCDEALVIKFLNISDPFQIFVISTFGKDLIRSYRFPTSKEGNSLYVHQLLSATDSKLLWLSINDFQNVWIIDELVLNGRRNLVSVIY